MEGSAWTQALCCLRGEGRYLWVEMGERLRRSMLAGLCSSHGYNVPHGGFTSSLLHLRKAPSPSSQDICLAFSQVPPAPTLIQHRSWAGPFLWPVGVQQGSSFP